VPTGLLNQRASGAALWLFSMHASAKSLEATSQFILMATVDEYAAKRHIDINRYDRTRMGELSRSPAGRTEFSIHSKLELKQSHSLSRFP
jgi:hypothetical protein